MNVSDFNEEQRLALLDLLVLAMYADGHLASAEDARVQRLLTAMGFDSEYDHEKEFDASVTRIRPHSETVEAARLHATHLAQRFARREHRRRVYELLDDLMQSDSRVSAEESRFLSVIGEILRI
jgi:uncharacterized tellurite resistance protein B-like protein